MPAQYRALWQTSGGGAGFSVLHYTIAGNGTAAQTLADQTQDFFDNLDSIMPNDTVINFDSEVLDLAEDGTLTAVWAVTPPAAITGAGAGDFYAAAGGRIDWATDAIVAGRRLSGRIYIVPLIGSAYDTDGSIDAAAQAVLQVAGDGLITDTSFNRPLRVWSRTHAVSAVVESAFVPAKGAVLRGRRD